MLTVLKNQLVPSPIFRVLWKNQINGILCIRSASKIPPGIVGKNKRVLPAHMYKPRPRWETGVNLSDFYDSWLKIVIHNNYISR